MTLQDKLFLTSFKVPGFDHVRLLLQSLCCCTTVVDFNILMSETMRSCITARGSWTSAALLSSSVCDHRIFGDARLATHG